MSDVLANSSLTFKSVVNKLNANICSILLSRFSPDPKPVVTDVAMASPSSVPTSPGPSALPETTPSPRHVTDTELDILQACLRRWRTEVEADVRDLQTRIATLKDLKDTVYKDDHLMNVSTQSVI